MNFEEAIRNAQEEQRRTVEAALAADREAALRDVFATAALGALIAANRNDSRKDDVEEAYLYADLMLLARKTTFDKSLS